MKDPSDAMQVAVFAALTNSAAVKALLGNPARVYDKVVLNPVYPFIRIGDDQAVGASNGCGDMWEFFVQVHAFSRHEETPRFEVKQINEAVAAAIADDASPISPTGFTIELTDFEQARTWEEDDGLTLHGLVRVRYLVADT